MQFNHETIRQHLNESEFDLLFNTIGWDNHTETLRILIDDTEYNLKAMAEKRGMVVYECQQTDPEGQIPDYATRRKIQKTGRENHARELYHLH